MMMSMKRLDKYASDIAVLALQELKCRLINGAAIKDLTMLDVKAVIEKLQAELETSGYVAVLIFNEEKGEGDGNNG